MSNDSIPYGAGHKQLNDSTEAPLQWHSATNTELVGSIEFLSNMLNHAVKAYGEDLKKEFKNLKRFQ